MVLTTFFYNFLKGFLFGFGFFTAIMLLFVIFIYLILLKAKRREKYNANDLLQPFKDYLYSLTENGEYEDCENVTEIIATLENGDMPKQVNDYNIKSSIEFKTIDVDDGSKFKFDKVYKITGKKRGTTKK